MVEYFGPRDLVLDGQWVSVNKEGNTQTISQTCLAIFIIFIVLSFLVFLFFLFVVFFL